MKKMYLFSLIFCVFFVCGCRGRSSAGEYELSVLVFITGVIAGSPPYELMAEGANEFARNNPNVNIKVYEAGVNQAEWEQQLSGMVSTGEYDVVLGSNPALPEICANVAKNFPNQKFIITDAEYAGHPQIRTYLYNQREQSVFLGYLAGLIAAGAMSNPNTGKKIGFIAAQEYPLLSQQMVPGFLEGALLADPQIELDMRVIGNWFDAAKAAELASAMIDAGVGVFTAIAGGAAQGMIKTASDRGAYIVWYNTDVYALAPGTIIGCGIMEQKKLVLEILQNVLDANIQYGVSETLGVSEGYIGFEFDNESYRGLPADVREKFEEFYYVLKTGNSG